jgi:hypothetical protein
MRRIALGLLAVVIASSAYAADGYQLHIRATDGRSALLSNPDYDKLAVTEEQLQDAAKRRVVVMTSDGNTHWRWLMLSWFENKPELEQAVNDRGVARTDAADFAFSASPEGNLRIRCLRDGCRINVETAEKATSIALKRGEVSADLPLDSTLAFTFTRS